MLKNTLLSASNKSTVKFEKLNGSVDHTRRIEWYSLKESGLSSLSVLTQPQEQAK